MNGSSGKRLFGLRGAACAQNTKDAIAEAVIDMCGTLFKINNLSARDIVSIHFTMTSDLDALNPATALRQSEFDVSSCALFCSQEVQIINMLPKTIRVLVTAYMDHDANARHVYVRGAETLRPDIV